MIWLELNVTVFGCRRGWYLVNDQARVYIVYQNFLPKHYCNRVQYLFEHFQTLIYNTRKEHQFNIFVVNIAVLSGEYLLIHHRFLVVTLSTVHNPG